MEDRRLLSGIEEGLGPWSPGAAATMIPSLGAPRPGSGASDKAAGSHAASVAGNDARVTIHPGQGDGRLSLNPPRSTPSKPGELAAIPSELIAMPRSQPQPSNESPPRPAWVAGASESSGEAPSSGSGHTPGPDELALLHSEIRAADGSNGVADLGGAGAAPGGIRARSLPRPAARRADSPAGSPELGHEPGAGAEPALSPRSSELLTDFLPCDRSSLEDAIDRFLDELGDRGGEWTGWASSSGLLPEATAVALTAVAAGAALQRWSRVARTGAPADGDEEDLVPSPGLPGAWSLAEP